MNTELEAVLRRRRRKTDGGGGGGGGSSSAATGSTGPLSSDTSSSAATTSAATGVASLNASNSTSSVSTSSSALLQQQQQQQSSVGTSSTNLMQMVGSGGGAAAAATADQHTQKKEREAARARKAMLRRANSTEVMTIGSSNHNNNAMTPPGTPGSTSIRSAGGGMPTPSNLHNKSDDDDDYSSSDEEDDGTGRGRRRSSHHHHHSQNSREDIDVAALYQRETEYYVDDDDDAGAPGGGAGGGGGGEGAEWTWPSSLQPPPLMATPSGTVSGSEPEFIANFEQGVGGEPLEYQPPTFDVSLMVEPKQPVDLSPLENVPIRAPPEIRMESNLFLKGLGQSPPPIVNPLTGNFIIVKRQQQSDKQWHLMEVNRVVVGSASSSSSSSAAASNNNAVTPMVVMSTPIVTTELVRKVMAVYGTSCVGCHSVVQVAAGVHRGGETCRVRVAALLELDVVTPSGQRAGKTTTNGTSTSNGTPPAMALAVWQWGYGMNHGTAPIALQSLLSPPNHADFSYQPHSLCIADSLLFLSGYARQKMGPCVFIARPTVKDTWAANFLGGGTTSSISAMAVTPHAHRQYKYLAIAMRDGSLSVWTYEGAVDRKAGKEEKVILPLCRLDGASWIGYQPVTRLTGDDGIVTGKDMPNDDGENSEPRFCTKLEWKMPDTSYKSPLWLAAAFTDGMALFHVSLPLLADIHQPDNDDDHSVVLRPYPSPKNSTQLDKTVSLPPFSASRWSIPSDRCDICWVDLGPQTQPTLAIWLEEEEVSAACMLGVVDLPPYEPPIDALTYQSKAESDTRYSPRPFRILVEHFLAYPTGGVLSTSSVGGIMCYGNGTMEWLVPSVSCDKSFFMSLRRPTVSAPPGLDSAGYVSLPDTPSDKDGVLHVYSIITCNRQINRRLSSPVPNTHRYEWSAPYLRHWLCRSRVGDTRDGQEQLDEENVTGGSYGTILCDLAFPGLSPFRIVRCKANASLHAVLFRSSLSVGVSAVDAISFALYENTSLLMRREGRDVVFLGENLLVLGQDGTMMYLLRKRVHDGNMYFDEGPPFRPLLGYGPFQDYVDCRRILCVKSGSETGLVVVGTKVTDNQVCLVAGNLLELKCNKMDGNNACDALSQNDDAFWTRLIPNLQDNNVMWLQSGEEVLTLAELPQYDEEGRRCLAVASQNRVMLLSSTMVKRSEIAVKLSSNSLASIGSHTVAFCSADFKIRYLCCLDGKFSQGIIATLPNPRFGHAPYHLMAIRPDRFLYFQYHSGMHLVERGDHPNTFLFPNAITRPAMLLEPMVSNALCEADNPTESTILLRAVIERFGRKVGSFPHGDDEGIGTNGMGLTPQVLEVLTAYGHKHPSSWLLTGTTRFDRMANSKVLPPWMPMSDKAAGCLNSDAHLHVIANGDQYFSEYVKSPDMNMASTLPRPTDPSAIHARELAKKAMLKGDVAGALKLLDLTGSQAADSAMLQLILASQVDPFTEDGTPALKALSGVGEEGFGSKTYNTAAASLAALAIELRSRRVNGVVPMKNGEIEPASPDFMEKYMRQLAPSIQRVHRAQRVRHRLIGEEALGKAVARKQEEIEADKHWNNPCSESKHVWSEGPFKDKENILLLGNMEDWLGRRRPAVLGKEGAAIALERGEKTLADILNRGDDYDNDDFGGNMDETDKDGWAKKVGEGREDDHNLSAYFRFSEGADEDTDWKNEGFSDLSTYNNKAIVIDQETTTIEATSSNVDEGEAGKMKELYDVCFEEHDGENPCGLLLQAPRGSSLDIGMLHTSGHEARKRATLEFWFHLPSQKEVDEDVILARRSVNRDDMEIAKLCIPSQRDSALWELALKRKTGELEFRTSGGTVLLSTEGDDDFEGGGTDMMGDFDTGFGGDDEEQDEEKEERGIVKWQREDGMGGWNHVCLVFSSRRQDDITDCLVTIFMGGKRCASTIATINPPGPDDAIIDSSNVDEAMARSVYLFALNPCPNFRFTELRLWACERKEDDIRAMQYEALSAAETKRKIRISIKKKTTTETSSPMKGGLLAPPKKPEAPSRAERKGFLAPPPGDQKDGDKKMPAKGLLPPPPSRKGKGAEEEEREEAPAVTKDAFGFPIAGAPKRESVKDPPLSLTSFGKFAESKSDQGAISAAFDPSAVFTFDEGVIAAPKSQKQKSRSKQAKLPPNQGPPTLAGFDSGSFGTNDQSSLGTIDIWVSSQPLSRQVRSSAAAALVRGPPATRHFGGNRGGLAPPDPSDRREHGKFGVGAVAICGAEKTVVYSHDRNPPGKTYPIGASGAIISDEMDNEGSEYLCCFLAKDKRMVVFELSTKTVVVELQMTTKLNYWRYLPPQAHGHTLVFMLITPVGGFHWMPLDESPRPRQVWKRGSHLQGKKIVAYEEGGSNGLPGAGARSTVALLLVSAASTGTPLEAWLMPVCGDSKSICVSSNVLGSALFRPYEFSEAFLPLLVTADKMNAHDVILEVQPLVESLATGSLGVGDVITCAIVDQRRVKKVNLQPPTLAMGTWPEVFVCCHENLIVAAIRRKGLLVAYEFKDGDLVLVRQETLNHYIIDAAVRSGVDRDEAEVVLLLSDQENPRDGRVVSMAIEMTSQLSRGSR